MKQHEVTVPQIGLIAGTRAMLGAGIALLLSEKLSGEQRRAIGWTLVAVGAQDWLTPPSASQSVAARLENRELIVIPGAGHFSFVEQPEIFNAAVRQFAAAATPAAGPGSAGRRRRQRGRALR